jgi:hypothetical protein
MCNGLDQYGNQQCVRCKSESQCGSGGSFYTLFKCYSGEISVDTSVCADARMYKNLASFECQQGQYLDTSTYSDSVSSTFWEMVFMSPNSSFVAEISPLDGNIMVHETSSSFKPFVKSNKLLEVSRDKGPGSSCASYSCTTFRYQASSGWVGSTYTFTHPMALDHRVEEFFGPGKGTANRVASGTWSVDGTSFFVVWMDGTISKAVVSPEAERSFVAAWSTLEAAPGNDVLVPLWTARHLPASAHASHIRHACEAVPVHTGTWATQRQLTPQRQVQLVCMFNFVRDQRIRDGTLPASAQLPLDAFGTYLARVRADGSRMQVVLPRHSAQFASTAMLYDQSFNVLYVTSFLSASFSGKKHILKARLGPSYNFIAEPPEQAPASQAPVPNALVPANFAMPAAASPGTVATDAYPAGISFEYAAIEPLSSSLFFYTPTLLNPTTYLNVLYYIPVDQNRGVGYVPNGERNMQPIRSEDPDLSPYAGRSLAPVSSVYNPAAGATIVFTMYAGIFTRFSWMLEQQPRFRSLMNCVPCPDRFTSDRGAQSRAECYCKGGTFLNTTSGECVPVTAICPANHFISRRYDRTNDNFCLPCFACPLGKYRNPSDCQRHVYRDPSKPADCLPCTSCPPGFYIDPTRCSPTSTYDSNPKTDCLPCNRCGYMQTVVGPVCPGNTLENWQSCQDCTASCPVGTYIAWHVERCNGFTRGSPTDPFDPITECVSCEDCPRCKKPEHGPDSGCEHTHAAH